MVQTITSSDTDTSQDAFLRIKADKVSQLLDLVGELGLAVAGVTQHPDLANLSLEGFYIAAHHLDVMVRDLQDLASSLRLVPVNDVFNRMQRLVRDLSRQTGKPAVLLLQGSDTEIDKVLVDQLYDPLLHLIRNSMDHGIESPAEREKAGKPAQGHITLSAVQQGGEIQITVADDGHGLNRKAILTKARKLGLVSETEEPADAVVWNYIFQPGFSTAQAVTSLSGRGVGMDVVQATVRSLRGRIMVDSIAGQGTRTTLHIPLTLAFLDSMIIRLDNQLFALPIDVVSEVFKPENDQVTTIAADKSEALYLRKILIPICRLQQFYRTDCRRPGLTEQVVVVVKTSRGLLGIPADNIVDQLQITIKPLPGKLKNIRAGAGCALLGSGDVAIVLDCEQLVERYGTDAGQ